MGPNQFAVRGAESECGGLRTCKTKLLISAVFCGRVTILFHMTALACLETSRKQQIIQGAHP
jgi:hypothetical protein